MLISSSNEKVCTDGNSPVTLGLSFNGVGPFSYTLKKDGQVFKQVPNSGSVASEEVTESGVYELEFVDNGLTEACGTTTSRDIIIEAFDVPRIVLTDNVDSICDNTIDSATLVVNLVSGNSPFTYQYTNGSVTETIQSSGLTSLIKTNLGGTFSLVDVVDRNGCSSTEVSGEVEVVLVPEPQPVLTVSDFTMCELEDSLVRVIPSVSAKSDELQWYREDIVLGDVPLDEGDSTVYRINKAGLYKVEQKNSSCSGYFTSTFEVTVTPLPLVEAGEDLRKEANEEFTLEEAKVAGDYTGLIWQEVLGGTPLFLDPASTLNPRLLSSEQEALAYTYVLTANNNGCLVRDSLDVSVFVPLTIYNTFSPNGDGVNDIWTIEGLERYEEVKMKIYDRWGQKIFDDKETRVWDGLRSGKSVPVGTYYYIIELKDPIEENEIKTGYITVVK